MLISANYAQIRCDKCPKVIHIMPDTPFEKIECDCQGLSYNDMDLEELRAFAKDKKIKSAMQMGRDKLLEKLKEV